MQRPAAEWFQRAAEQGMDLARNALGDVYAEGRGVEQDYSESAR
jgi:TPR repeat protein